MKRTLAFLFATLLAARGFADPATPGAADPATPVVESRAEAAETAGGGTVYERVYAALAALPERRVGSENYAKAFDAVEAELQAAGLKTHRQTFDSLAQVTERLSLTYAGKPVEGALMVDNGLAGFVLPEPIRGPAVFVGDGSLDAIDGKDLEGAVAVVDISLPDASLRECFAHGAAAAVLVGDGTADQWRLGGVSFTPLTLVPRVYVPRDRAEAAGLLAADGSAELALDARATLRDVQGCNLWAELPCTGGWTNGLAAEELVVLSASLDTYGLTPDLSPDLRLAANAALLADVACELARRGPTPRHVLVVFFGSRYGGMEGPRFFYHALDMADRNVNPVDLDVRAGRYEAELANARDLLAWAETNHIVAASTSGALARDMQGRLKKRLVAMANGLRSRISSLNLEEKAARDAGREADADRIAAELASLRAERDACNAVREQLNRNAWRADNEPKTVEVYEARRADVIADLRLREEELVRMIANNETWRELSNLFRPLALVGHFDFDFSSDSLPWAPSMNESSGLYRYSATSSGSYMRVLSAIRALYYGEGGIAEGRLGEGAADPWAAPLYEKALSASFKPFSLSFPRQREAPAALPAALGRAGFELITVGESEPRDNLPVAEPCDLSGLRGQMADFAAALASFPGLSLRQPLTAEQLETRLTYTDGEGVNYQDYAPGSTDSQGLPPRAIATFAAWRHPAPLPGLSPLPRARILANGRIYMPFVARDTARTSSDFLDVAVGYDENGAVDRVSTDSDSHGLIATPVHLFHAYGGLSFGNGYQPDPVGGDMYHAETLVASKDAPHKTFANVELEPGLREFFADRPDPVKIIGANGDMLLGSRPWSNAADRVKNAMGLGVELDAASRLHSDNVAQAASDAFLLNEARLGILRDRNIVRDDLEKIHADAKDHVEAASAASSQRRWSLARAHHIVAACLENRVYGPLRGVTEDLVEAVVVLLLLNIPFAFAMERLVFGFPSIYKQILGFVGFFLATFAILYATHPAFALASAPVVIFLAFVIILLGAITTAIMMGKIKEEIRKLQGLASTVHGVESESSTTLSAILIGIAGMRNRPLKTFLTCATVVLLTFTILVFASFSSQLGVVETYLGRGAGDNRIELHRLSFLDIDDGWTDALRALHGDRFALARRGGVFRVPTRRADTGDTPTNPERYLYLPRTGESLEMGAIMGADPEEFRLSSELRAVRPDFGEGDFAHPPLYLPPIVTNALSGLVAGDELRLNGQPFSFAGFFDPAALQNAGTIDDLKAVPPDFQSTLANSGRQATGGADAASLEQFSTGAFEWFSPDRVALARMDDVRAIWGPDCTVNFLVLYPRDADADLDALAAELAPAFQGAVHVKSANGARRLFFSKAVRGSGFGDVVIPLLLGGLIIFSSLMGSIVAREKEIFTYSALGLAPVDVGALFFAESAVYSVIGGMGGYLLSQLVAKLLHFMGSRGWIVPPEMNFSSLTSVCTILIVMAVVMLSTIFPAMRASKSANPGVARKWKMPRPKGDKLEFVFPFTVNTVDFAGILSFIREHFENHADATLGSFAARDVKLFRHPDPKNPARESIGIEASVSLAPFDLGIFQKFRMYSQEFEIKGIDEVVVDLTRIGGSPVSWQRSNRDFAAELREQFLLWRSLPIATVEHYRSQTKSELGLS